MRKCKQILLGCKSMEDKSFYYKSSVKLQNSLRCYGKISQAKHNNFSLYYV